jgi:phosphatidylglycerophosphate synthase
MCTTVGVFGSLVTLTGYLLSRGHPAFFWLASLGFLINWYGDSLDGTLARYRKIERPVYGFFIDHTTDALTQVMVFVGLGLSPYVTFNVAVLTLVGYLLMSVLVYVRTCVVAEFRISYGKLGPTEDASGNRSTPCSFGNVTGTCRSGLGAFRLS